MPDDQPRKPRSEADAELEREIREGRKFTLRVEVLVPEASKLAVS